MSMNATQESNMQRTGYRTIVGKHGLTDQQARVFDTLDPRPDIPRSQFNVGTLSHGTSVKSRLSNADVISQASV